MITAGRSKNKSTPKDSNQIETEIEALKSQFGIGQHYLEKLLER
jgi:cell division protein FtsB